MSCTDWDIARTDRRCDRQFDKDNNFIGTRSYVATYRALHINVSFARVDTKEGSKSADFMGRYPTSRFVKS